MKSSVSNGRDDKKGNKVRVRWRVCFGLFVVLSGLLGNLRDGAARPDPTVIMVLPFEGQGEGTGDEWLGEYFAEGLSRLLKTSGDLLVADELARREVYQWAGLVYPQPVSLSTALLLAREAGADWLIYGTYRVSVSGQAHVRFRLIHLNHRVPPRTFRDFVWREDQPLPSLEAMGRVLVEALQQNGFAVEIDKDPWMDAPFARVRDLMKVSMIPNPEDRWRRLERLIARNPDVKLWRLAQLRLALERWDTGGVVGEALDRWLSESGIAFERPEDRFLLATWHYLNQRWNAALEMMLSLSTIISVPGLVSDIGVVLTRLKRYEDAEYYFARARRVQKGVITVWNPTVLAYQRFQMDEIQAGLRDLWRLNPSGPTVDLMARVFQERGRDDLLNELRAFIATTGAEINGNGSETADEPDYVFVYPLVPVWRYFETRWMARDPLKMTAFMDYEEFRAWAIQRFYMLMEREPAQVPQWLHFLEWIDASSFPVRLQERWLNKDFGCGASLPRLSPGFTFPAGCCPVLSDVIFESE